MDNKIYYHNFNKKNTLLAKCLGRCSFILHDNNDNTCFVMLNNKGYYLEGIKPTGIDFYKKDNNFYIVNGQNSTSYYITIQPLSVYGVGSFENGYGISFDTTNYTKLEIIKEEEIVEEEKTPIVNTPFPDTYYEANTVVNHTLQLNNKTNYSQSALLLISVRNSNGIGGSGLLLVSSINSSTINNFEILTISSTGNFNQFTVEGLQNGITITHNTKFKFSITEIDSDIVK